MINKFLEFIKSKNNKFKKSKDGFGQGSSAIDAAKSNSQEEILLQSEDASQSITTEELAPSSSTRKEIRRDFYSRGKIRERGPSKGDTELDNTPVYHHGNDSQGKFRVWEEKDGVLEPVKDVRNFRDKDMYIDIFLGGIVSEQLDLKLLFDIVSDRLIKCKETNFSDSSRLELESALDSLEFHINNYVQNTVPSPELLEFAKFSDNFISNIKSQLERGTAQQEKRLPNKRTVMSNAQKSSTRKATSSPSFPTPSSRKKPKELKGPVRKPRSRRMG